MLPSNRP